MRFVKEFEKRDHDIIIEYAVWEDVGACPCPTSIPFGRETGSSQLIPKPEGDVRTMAGSTSLFQPYTRASGWKEDTGTKDRDPSSDKFWENKLGGSTSRDDERGWSMLNIGHHMRQAILRSLQNQSTNGRRKGAAGDGCLARQPLPAFPQYTNTVVKTKGTEGGGRIPGQHRFLPSLEYDRDREKYRRQRKRSASKAGSSKRDGRLMRDPLAIPLQRLTKKNTGGKLKKVRGPDSLEDQGEDTCRLVLGRRHGTHLSSRGLRRPKALCDEAQ